MTEPEKVLSATDLGNVLLVIQTGIFDSSLDDIVSAVSRRRKIIGLEKAADLAPGDVVVINDRVSPKLLTSARVKIDKIDPDGKIHGILQGTYSRKWQHGQSIWVTPGLIDHKEEPADAPEPRRLINPADYSL